MLTKIRSVEIVGLKGQAGVEVSCVASVNVIIHHRRLDVSSTQCHPRNKEDLPTEKPRFRSVLSVFIIFRPQESFARAITAFNRFYG